MTTVTRLHRANHCNHFRAYRLRGIDPAQVDPFLAVDHAWISAPTFPPHPHAGFSAVSYLFLDSETGISNRDSLGNSNLILPGGLHWTVAGRGVVHEEVPAAVGKTVHMLQIFINLPRDLQSAEPFTMSLSPQDITVVQLPGIRIRVPLGGFGESRSPLLPPTEVSLLDISLDDGAELSVPVAAGQSAFVMPIFGTLMIDGQRFDCNELRLPILPAQAEARTVKLLATQGNAKAALFAGTPLRQPVYWQGHMALSSADALANAISSYQRGEFGTLHCPAEHIWI
ncbi:pirin family protein [Ferribacterium limneticum]|uniref:pirin family protein n=1 Tax=Ferribacterium limneticum TaxID=76259 RepID=UPI001CFB12E8|nr:pirin family protein [Ferribacterium limneticum]UCV17855.1 pirin family protein [Ferribacterium limneticum]